MFFPFVSRLFSTETNWFLLVGWHFLSRSLVKIFHVWNWLLAQVKQSFDGLIRKWINWIDSLRNFKHFLHIMSQLLLLLQQIFSRHVFLVDNIIFLFIFTWALALKHLHWMHDFIIKYVNLLFNFILELIPV